MNSAIAERVLHYITSSKHSRVYCFEITSYKDLLWVFSVFCALCPCARLFIFALWSPAGKGLTSWLSFVVYNCEFVTVPLVFWVRCGTLLYGFLIFVPLLTLTVPEMTELLLNSDQRALH